MALIDEQYTRTPFYGWRRMTNYLRRVKQYQINGKRVRRLMRLMGLQAVGPKPGTKGKAVEHKIYPYLLRNLTIVRPNQVWSSDITYIRMSGGFMYLTAIIDWPKVSLCFGLAALQQSRQSFLSAGSGASLGSGQTRYL